MFVGICTLSFYAININVVSLFAKSSYLFLAILNLYCISLNFVKKTILKRDEKIKTIDLCFNYG